MDEELRSQSAGHDAVAADAAAQVAGRPAAGLAAGRADGSGGLGQTDRMPAMYLGHGVPPLADDPPWTTQLAAWSGALPRPRAILVVSARWEPAPHHGACVPLTVMHPEAGLPVLQVSMPALDPDRLLLIGAALAPLRGGLIHPGGMHV